MEFRQLSNEYMDDVLAEALYAREVEYFHYRFDLKNFEIIADNTLDEIFRNSLLTKIKETKERMAQVESIYSALEAQIPNEFLHRQAIARVTAKREAKNVST